MDDLEHIRSKYPLYQQGTYALDAAIARERDLEAERVLMQARARRAKAEEAVDRAWERNRESAPHSWS